MTREQDAELVRRCIDDSPGAWEAFVERYRPLVSAAVRGAARRRGATPSHLSEEDLVQEVFSALLRNDRALLRNYDGRASFSTYLYVVSASRTLNHLGPPRKPPIPLADAFLAEPGSTPEPSRLELEEELDRLPDRDRLILQLVYLQELSEEAIALRLGISPGSVATTLARARERARKILAR